MALDLNTNGIHLFIAVSVLEWQRLVLSSLSKSFSRNPEKIFHTVDVQLLVKLSLALEFMNLTKIDKFVFFTCNWLSFRPQTFNSYNYWDVLVKMRTITVLAVVVVSHRNTSNTFAHKKLFPEGEPGDFSCIA